MFEVVPQTGRTGNITLNDLDMMLVPGTWTVKEAERFSDKISQGAISYADFNVYEQAWPVIDLSDGYGLKRVSDMPLADPKRRQMYHEASGVNCRESGTIMLGPKLQVSPTALTGTPLWIGEVTPSTGTLATVPQLVVVTDDGKVYTVNTDYTLTLRVTLPAAPQRGAIGTFLGVLVIGYGATRTGQYTTDLTTLGNVANGTPTNIYVWAFTADRAAAYVAGGPNATDWWKVVSSTTGSTGYSAPANEVKCGDGDSKITGLAPGGGLALLFIGLESEVGEIDNDAVYRQLVPFDSRLSTNNRLFRWLLAADGESQRGPLMLFFSRERSLWSYQPSSQSAGEAKNVAPWAQTGIHPEHVRGIPTALQGGARWIYYAIHNMLLDTYYVSAIDARTGATHSSLIDLGGSECRAMSISALIGNDPRLYLGYGDGFASAILPLDGDSPLDNPSYEFTSVGTLDLAEIDFDFPDEQKILFVVRVIAENLVPASRYVEMYASYDGGDYEFVDSISSSPAEISFPTDTSVRRVGLRFKLYTDNVFESPLIKAIVLRGSINAKLYQIWEFTAKVPPGSLSGQSDDPQNPHTLVQSLWTARRAGTPVLFTDRWNDAWAVRILALQEQETLGEVDRPPERHVSVRLLEVERSYLNASFWDDPFFIWDEPTSIWSSGDEFA